MMKRLLLLGLLLPGSLLWAKDVNGIAVNKQLNAELFHAARRYDIESARTALAKGANVNHVDLSYGGTSLLRAVSKEDLDMISMLLEADADVNHANIYTGEIYTGETPLLMAVVLDNVGIVEMLIKHGADVDCTDVLGHTPLYKAILDYLPAIDHKLGSVQGEEAARAESIEKGHPMVSFVLNKAQTEKVLDYIKTVQAGCEDHDYDHCTYHFVTRNCLTLTQEVFHAAGFEGSPFDSFSQEQLTYTASSFESFYNTKALFYAAWFKTANF